MDKWLTKEEQHIILFLLIVTLVGSGIMFMKYKKVNIAYELLTADEGEYSPGDEVSAVNESLASEVTEPEEPQVNHFKKRQGLPPNVKININTATLEELDFLPRIGPATAQRIIEHREKYGGFKSITDIQKVKGIGPSTFEGMKNNITVKDEN